MASGTELLSISGRRVSSWGIREGTTSAIKQRADECVLENLSDTHKLKWPKAVAANLAKKYFLQLLINL